MKELCQQMEGKTNFSGRLHMQPETGIIDCLENIDVGCNLKQFDGLT